MAAAAVEATTAAAAVLSAVEENPAADILAACVLLALAATAAAAHPERAAVWAPRGEVRQEEVRARVVLRIFVPPSTTANGIHLLLRTQPVKLSPPTIPEWPTTIGTDLTAPEKPVLEADSADQASVGAAVGVAAMAGVSAVAVAGVVGPSASDGRSGALTGDLPGGSVGVRGGTVLPGTGRLTLIPITRTPITVTTGPTILRPMLRRLLRPHRRTARPETVLQLALTRQEKEMT